MTTLVLIRHAAHGLLGQRIVGRKTGVGLSPEGRRQAEALAERLARAPIDALYSSPLERARQTAEPIAARIGLEVRIAEELNELDYGAWTDRTFEELHALEAWRRYNEFRSGTRMPQGESMLDVQSRLLGLIERLSVLHRENTVALVSHGDVIKAGLAFWLGVPLDLFRRIDVRPASISVVRIGAYGPEVLMVNGGWEQHLLEDQGSAG